MSLVDGISISDSLHFMIHRLSISMMIASLVLLALASGFHAHSNMAVDDQVTIQLSDDGSADFNPFGECEQCECHLGCGHILGHHDILNVEVPVAMATSYARYMDRVRGSPHYSTSKPPKTIA
ncbi:MAG: hypothetical protein ACPG06_03835 [Alphaproteobacteria bacterium]